MSNDDEPTDRRTEGVRIIGAQEAAEAAGRPDVVRRRRRSEKRFGDRPDVPEPASDLPKITISTTDGEVEDQLAPYGGQLVQPEDDRGEAGSGQGASSGLYSEEQRTGWGHARIVDDVDDIDDIDLGSGGDYVDDRHGGRSVGSASDEVAAGADDGPVSEWPGDDTSLGWDGERAEDWDSAAGSDDELLGDDSFVLPHWTEPPTGQVPKVVIGEEEPEPLATYGTQPRWRDEGERTAVTDFDDLVDDGPALGALASDRVADDFFAQDPYGDADPFDDEAVHDDDASREQPEVSREQRRRQRRPRDEPAASNGSDRPLGLAIGVGVALVAVGLLCFKFGALTTTLLAAVVVTFAAFEYFTAVRERGNNPATLLGMVSVAGLMVAASTSGLAAYPVVLGLTVITGLLWYLWVAPGDRAVQNLGLTLLGVLWIGFLGSFATLFLGLGRMVEDSSPDVTSNPGIGVLIAAVIASVSHDVGAYFVGRYKGNTPLSPASPNKTQEGLMGGVLSSLIVTFVVVGFVGISPVGDQLSQAFIFALLCAIVAPLGDLCESFIKRDLGIKDMGSVLPGHGGVLDRFDALLFVLPVAYFVTVLFDIWGTVGT